MWVNKKPQIFAAVWTVIVSDHVTVLDTFILTWMQAKTDWAVKIVI